MIRCVDGLADAGGLFAGGAFSMDGWERYINALFPGCARLFQQDMEAYLAGGRYTFDRDFLPILNALRDECRVQALRNAFAAVTDRLDERVKRRFGAVSVDITLYAGLCNAAGWVTRINGAAAILLGAEKILELRWQDADALRALIYHELGHVWHAQRGALAETTGENRRAYVYQLFCEGVAMVFEQELTGDPGYFHQDKNGWKAWCAAHFADILADFDRDAHTITRFDQRYFGDWCDYRGHGDAGYYLGARFVRELMVERPLEALIFLDMDAVCGLFAAYVRRHSRRVRS